MGQIANMNRIFKCLFMYKSWQITGRKLQMWFIPQISKCLDHCASHLGNVMLQIHNSLANWRSEFWKHLRLAIINLLNYFTTANWQTLHAICYLYTPKLICSWEVKPGAVFKPQSCGCAFGQVLTSDYFKNQNILIPLLKGNHMLVT